MGSVCAAHGPVDQVDLSTGEEGTREQMSGGEKGQTTYPRVGSKGIASKERAGDVRKKI